MKKRAFKQVIIFSVLLVFSAMLMTACGKDINEDKGDSQTEENSQNQTKEEQSLYLIVEHNTLEEGLVLYSYETELEHYYSYGFSTKFRDKYGNYSQASAFEPGNIVTIGERNSDGLLSEMQLSDQVWVYEKVRRFSVDEEQGVFTIADTRYSVQDRVYVFSNGERTNLTELSNEKDVLTVVGKGKQILSIIVTTGHGNLVLRNTELFDGSFLQLNKDIFAIISDSMELDLPEGIYTLKVANDGWGGTTEIEIIRGETTEVDLDTLKGEGRKKGIVRFTFDTENVKVYIDGEKIDHTEPVELIYGIHVLEIKAEGYDTWKNRLVVNSEDATIEIELTETEDDKDKTEDKEDKESKEDKEENKENKEENKDTEKSEDDSEETTEEATEENE